MLPERSCRKTRESGAPESFSNDSIFTGLPSTRSEKLSRRSRSPGASPRTATGTITTSTE